MSAAEAPCWTSSLPAPSQRAACLLRQAGLLATVHGNALTAVEHNGNVIDGLSRCVHRRCSSTLAAHGSQHHLCPHAVLIWTPLVRVAGILGASFRSAWSTRGRHLMCGCWLPRGDAVLSVGAGLHGGRSG